MLIAGLVAGFVLYVMVARGVFESTQQLVLISDDSEGVIVGMDLTFSGFPIGRVRRIELAADGMARMVVDVPHKEAHWLRTSSIFTLERGMVGDTRIRAYSGIMSDPPVAAQFRADAAARRHLGRNAAPDRLGPGAAGKPGNHDRHRVAAQRQSGPTKNHHRTHERPLWRAVRRHGQR